MNDLLNIELVNDNVKKFDRAWEENLMALEQAPEKYLFEGLYQQEKKTKSLQTDGP